jgi:ATP-binding cassette subfamily B (MDR/TAP) protein 1
MLFSSIVYKDIAWFDSKEKAPGVLSNVISEDITLLNGLSTESISILIESVFTLVVGLIIALCLSWKMALITCAILPLLILGGAISNRLTAKAKGYA